MSSIEIENQIDAKEKELKVMLQNLNVVEQQKLNIQRSILELQLEKKKLDIIIDKGTHNVRETRIDIKLFTRQFWAAKNSGG